MSKPKETLQQITERTRYKFVAIALITQSNKHATKQK